MPDLPGKELIDEADRRFGTRAVSIVLGLGLLAAGIFFTSYLFKAAKGGFALLPSLQVQSIGWRDFASGAAVIALYAVGFWFLRSRLQSVEILVTSGEVARMPSRLDHLNKRLTYVEGKVGDELLDMLVERDLIAKGIEPDELRRLIREFPAPPQLAHPQVVRVAQMQAVLREGAACARKAVDAPVNMDRQAERAWLHAQLMSLITECFDYRVIADFEAFLRSREQKLEARNQRPDGRSHFGEFADYFDRLANKLRLEDIDQQADLPGSFEQFTRRNS